MGSIVFKKLLALCAAKHEIAKSRAVSPYLSFFWPRRGQRNAWMASVWPLKEAIWRAVRPLLSFSLAREGSMVSNVWMASVWPETAAVWRAVRPMLFFSLARERSKSSNVWMASVWPRKLGKPGSYMVRPALQGKVFHHD